MTSGRQIQKFQLDLMTRCYHGHAHQQQHHHHIIVVNGATLLMRLNGCGSSASHVLARLDRSAHNTLRHLRLQACACLCHPLEVL